MASHPSKLLSRVLALGALVFVAAARAQIAVNFSTADAGVAKGIPTWGLDTNWANLDNMRRGLSYMGSDLVNAVRVPAMVDQPLDSGLTADQKAHLQLCQDLAAMVAPSAKWDMCAPGSDTVNAWFQSGTGTVNVDRWVQAMKLNQHFYRHPFWMVEPFNEPDYPLWGEGSPQNLSDLMGTLSSATEFTGAAMAGGSTMSTDHAASWYDALNGRAAIGTTHCLYGSVANYVDFIQHVAATHGTPVNPEGHNVVEAIIGAEYGLNAMIWWGTAELTRGRFVRASQGVRLGYGEDRTNWTAAAVYRAPSGQIQAFLGSGERVGGTTTYTFHATDRDVYYDGHGPQRDYTVTIARNQERVINITWGADAPPVLGGRYVVVNANSGLCLEAAGASTANGSAIQQNAYNGGSHQLWNITPLAADSIGDLSYFVIANANSGLNADLADWKYDDEAAVKQYGYPANSVEHWYFDYVGNGYFAIRSRWSTKCLSIAGGASSIGAGLVQRTYRGTLDQLWRLQDPATTPTSVPLTVSMSPLSATAASGETVAFAADAVGTGKLSYQWQLNDTAIAGATNARLILPNVQTASAGSYRVVVADVSGTMTSTAATLTLKTTRDIGRLTNLSIRSQAGTGDQTLIAGFAIGGPGGTKPVLIRAIGPTLTAFAVPGALAAPKLDLYGNGALMQSGTAWGGSAALTTMFNSVGAFPLDAGSKDAAFVPTLPGGSYTAQATGIDGTTGVALLELYDASSSGQFDATTTSRLINASARTQVGTGDNVLIAGFAISGSTARTVLIRATGPALAAYGVAGTLSAPKLELIRDNVVLATNLGWGGDPQLTTVGNGVGAFPLTDPLSRDSILLLTLPPGTYSAKVSGADGGTGIALVEVYEVP